MARIRVDLDEIPDFIGPDPGEHRAKLTDCVEDESQQGNPMLVWSWEVIEGDSKGRTINSYTSLLDDALGGLKVHLKAFGYEGQVDVNTDKLINKTARIIVVKRKYRDRDTKEEKEGMSVSNVLPDEPGSKGKSKGKGKASLTVSDDDDDIPF